MRKTESGPDEIRKLEKSGLIRKGAAPGQSCGPDKAGEHAGGSGTDAGNGETDADEMHRQNGAFPDTSRDAVKKAMNLLLCGDRTEKELRARLLKEKYEPEAVCDAIRYVSSFGYLDDGRYAENYVASFAGKKSRRMMRSELERKGVDEVLIDRALDTVPEDESEQVMELLRKKAGMPHKLDDREKRRVAGFLSRRGFSGSDIWKAIRAFESEADI